MRRVYTWESAKKAKNFGLVGGLVGGALGLVIEGLSHGGSSKIDYALTAGLGSAVVGSVFQVGGMMYVNKEEAGPGLLITPILGAGGFASGVYLSRFKTGNTDIKTNITMGVLGLTAGALTGAALDVVIPDNNNNAPITLERDKEHFFTAKER
tara:strand:- start:3634 stop:4092 length:459 start_codon:yes stop_codon:yes gene_type:complete